MRTALWLAMVASVGCSASLRGDGYYACADDRCPTGYVCHSDGRCYTHPEDAAVLPDTSAPVDAFVPSDGGAATCGGTTQGTCPMMQMCVAGQWTAPPAMPSLGCATVGDIANARHGTACTPAPGACSIPDSCIMSSAGNRCMRPCAPSSPCGFMEDCVATTGGTSVCAQSCSGVCPMFGLSCRPTPSSGMRCLPNGW